MGRARWVMGSVLAASVAIGMGACAPPPRTTLIHTSSVNLREDGSMWFVERYRQMHEDRVFLVECRGDPPTCERHAVEPMGGVPACRPRKSGGGEAGSSPMF